MHRYNNSTPDRCSFSYKASFTSLTLLSIHICWGKQIFWVLWKLQLQGSIRWGCWNVSLSYHNWHHARFTFKNTDSGSNKSLTQRCTPRCGSNNMHANGPEAAVTRHKHLATQLRPLPLSSCDLILLVSASQISFSLSRLLIKDRWQ